jgi:hypothetical protein
MQGDIVNLGVVMDQLSSLKNKGDKNNIYSLIASLVAGKTIYQNKDKKEE